MDFQKTPESRLIRAGSWWLVLGWIGLAVAGCTNLNEARQNIARNQTQDVSPVRQKRTEEVARDFDRNRDNAQFEAAASCWQRGDAEGCKRMLAQLLERNPSYRRARFVLADIYLFDGDSTRAINELQAAVAANPGDAMAHHALAQVLDASGQRSEALSHYRSAVTLEPNNELYALSYNTIFASTAAETPVASAAAPQSPPADAPKSKVGSGVTITDRPMPPTESNRDSLARKGKPAPSRNVGKDPNQQQPPVKFAAVDDWVRPIDYGANSPDKAASDSLDGARHAPPQIAPTSAAPVVAGPVSGRPAETDSHDAKTSDRSAVVASYSAASAKPADPQNQHNLLQRAVEALAQGDTEGAIELATAGLAQIPERSASLYRVLGAAHYRRGEYQAAQIALAQALSLDKSDALSYFLMGSTLAKLGQSETAARCFAEAARLDPRYGS